MANIKVRHLVQKGDSFYWQPSTALRQQGWKARKLAGSLEAAISEAEKINDELDRWRSGKTDISAVPVLNSVSSVITMYKNSKNYRKLGDNTKEDYDYRLELIEKWAGKVPIEGITRKSVRDFWEKLSKKSEWKANATIRILRLLLNFAIDIEVLQINPAARPGLLSIPPRDIVWALDEVLLAVKIADKFGWYNVGTAIMLSAFLAQREADVLKLDWRDYQNGVFLIRQNKTRAYIAVPVHPILKQRLLAGRKA